MFELEFAVAVVLKDAPAEPLAVAELLVPILAVVLRAEMSEVNLEFVSVLIATPFETPLTSTVFVLTASEPTLAESLRFWLVVPIALSTWRIVALELTSSVLLKEPEITPVSVELADVAARETELVTESIVMDEPIP